MDSKTLGMRLARAPVRHWAATLSDTALLRDQMPAALYEALKADRARIQLWHQIAVDGMLPPLRMMYSRFRAMAVRADRAGRIAGGFPCMHYVSGNLYRLAEQFRIFAERARQVGGF